MLRAAAGLEASAGRALTCPARRFIRFVEGDEARLAADLEKEFQGQTLGENRPIPLFTIRLDTGWTGCTSVV
jgi:hypothetical protein